VADGRVAGRVALVTGAARGQGAAEAELLAAEGAAVVLTDLLDEEGEATAERIRANGGTAVYRHLDVSSSEQWDEVTAAARDEGCATPSVTTRPAKRHAMRPIR